MKIYWMDMTFYDARYVYKQRVIQPKDEVAHQV